MRRVRAVLGVLVLLAVPMIGVLVSVTLIVLGVFLLDLVGGGINGPGEVFVLLVVGGVITLVVTFVRLVRALRGRPVTDGVPLSRDRAPRVWSIVERLAARIGVPAPAEIRLTPEADAAIAVQARWLGLRRGRRVLLIGHPLLAGLTVGPLVAVIAHELGHLTSGDPGWGRFAKRGAAVIANVRDGFRPGGMLHSLHSGLFRLFARISQSEQHRLEFGADRTAAMLAGRDALEDALRRSPGVAVVWQNYLNRVEEVSDATGALPPDLGAGFVAYLAEESVQRLVAEIADRPADQTDSVDSHPPIARRVLALRDLPATDVDSDDRPALVLLDGNLIEELYRSLLAPPEASRPVLDWPELIPRGDAAVDLRAARSALAAAQRLTGEPVATPRTLVALVDGGRAAHLAGELSGAGGPVDVSPGSYGAGLLTAALHTVARAAAAAAGGYRYVLHWPGPEVVSPNGTPLPTRTGPADRYAAEVLRSVPQDFTGLLDDRPATEQV